PDSGVGAGEAQPEADRGPLHRLGGRHPRDGDQVQSRAQLPAPHRVRQRAGQGEGAAGLAGPAGLQPPVLRHRGVRQRPPLGLPGRSRRPRGPAARRRHRRRSEDPLLTAVNHTAPIGVFDSGIGGLTVARALYERLPGESTIYFGDTARVPYGPKSPETVRRYSLEILHWLLGQGVKLVVVACNTSTAHALGALREQSPVPVIGVIEPGARAAVAATRGGPVGVIGTAGTIASKAYPRAIHALAPGLRVEQAACPLFVPLVEEGWFDHPAAELIARDYLRPLAAAAVDVLVLGCTHYPLLKPLLGRVMGQEVRLIDSAAETARAVAETLATEGLEAPAGQAVFHRFVVSDDEPRFRQVGSRVIGEKLTAAEIGRASCRERL